MQRTPKPLLQEIKGIILLVVVGSLIWLSIAIYLKQFTSTVDITVQTERTGLQLNDNADVRMRGALVGRVEEISHRDGRAVLTIALDEDAARRIPGDVQVRILPTTLFGQKYIELVEPASSTAGPVKAGAVLAEDRSATAIEITQAFDDLEPVLSAVRPQDLSVTLQALAEGLEGRGEQLGTTTVSTLRLLRDLRPHLPLLAEDLRLLGAVSEMYGASMDDILTILDNMSTSSRSVTSLEKDLKLMYGDVTTFSKTAKAFLDANGDGIIDLNKTTAPVLRVLARYAPEFQCLLHGLVVANDEFNTAFRLGKLHNYSVLGLQYPGYGEPDAPGFGASPPGPSCAGMPGANGDPHVVMPKFDDGGRYTKGEVVAP